MALDRFRFLASPVMSLFCPGHIPGVHATGGRRGRGREGVLALICSGAGGMSWKGEDVIKTQRWRESEQRRSWASAVTQHQVWIIGLAVEEPSDWQYTVATPPLITSSSSSPGAMTQPTPLWWIPHTQHCLFPRLLLTHYESSTASWSLFKSSEKYVLKGTIETEVNLKHTPQLEYDHCRDLMFIMTECHL